mmetsp:Transcript_11028/g.35009  ORF Transcript_11028/g.35009 Transcript_11028/m.35009 type:complete len:265 (+) Transcript_11028:347-1141(+)
MPDSTPFTATETSGFKMVGDRSPCRSHSESCSAGRHAGCASAGMTSRSAVRAASALARSVGSVLHTVITSARNAASMYSAMSVVVASPRPSTSRRNNRQAELRTGYRGAISPSMPAMIAPVASSSGMSLSSASKSCRTKSSSSTCSSSAPASTRVRITSLANRANAVPDDATTFTSISRSSTRCSCRSMRRGSMRGSVTLGRASRTARRPRVSLPIELRMSSRTCLPTRRTKMSRAVDVFDDESTDRPCFNARKRRPWFEASAA